MSITTTSDDNYYAVSSYDLHGRQRIFTNVSEINPTNVIQVLNECIPTHNKNRFEEQYLEKYLRGIQPILSRTKEYNSEINNQVVVNLANTIVAFKKSEFAGEPIQYVSRGSKKTTPKKVERINSMMISEGKQGKDMELAHQMFTTGVGYRLILKDKAEDVAKGNLYDEAPFEIYIPDSANTFVIRRNDVSKRVVAGVTYVFTGEDQCEYTVYTPNQTITVMGTAQQVGQVTNVVTHNFGMVTLVEYPCNTVRMGAFEPALSLLDAINEVSSSRADAVDMFVQAIMVFEGMDVTEEDLTKLKEYGILSIPPSSTGSQGKVYYLNEQLDQAQTQTLIDDYFQDVLQIVGMPSQGNANTSDSSNNGAVIMKNGWWNAEARALETETLWKESETEFLKIVLKICSEAGVLNGLAVSDVEPKFGRHSYEDLLVKTQSFSTLTSAGCPPIQAFTFSKLSKDPESDAMVYEAFQEKEAVGLDELVTEVRKKAESKEEEPVEDTDEEPVEEEEVE